MAKKKGPARKKKAAGKSPEKKASNLDSKNISLIFALLILILLWASVLHHDISVDKQEMPSDLEEDVKDVEYVEPEPEAPEEAVLEEPPAEVPEQVEPSEVRIKTLRTGFDQDNVVMNTDTLVYWQNTDDRVHKVACYYNKKRVFLGNQMKPGEEFSYRFMNPGKYLCRDAVFGYWGNITVKGEPVLSGYTTNPLSGIIPRPIETSMLGMLIVLFTVHIYNLWFRKT